MHDALQGQFHGIAVRQLGAGVAVAIAIVDRFVMGQNAKEGQAVLLDLSLDAVVQHTAGGPVDDETHLAGVQIHFFDHLRDPVKTEKNFLKVINHS